MKQTAEIDNVVVGSGRRPRGRLLSQDELPHPPRGPARRDVSDFRDGSGDPGFDLCDVARSDVADRNAARLHRLGDLPLQVNDEQTVLGAGALDLDMLGERELALDIACRDAAMQVDLLFLLALAALECQDVLLDRQETSSGVNPARATEIWKRFSSRRSML